MLAQLFEKESPGSLSNFIEDALGYRVVAGGVFTNTTPLWVGDAFGDTVTRYGLALPSPGAVIGRARWVIKTVALIASNIYRLDRVEALASRLFGSVGDRARASGYRLIVVPEQLCSPRELYLSLDHVRQLIKSLPQEVLTVSDIKCVQSMIESLRCHGYAMLLEEIGEVELANFVRSGCDSRFRHQVGRCYHVTKRAVTDFVRGILKEARGSELVRRYLILSTVPRYYLAVHGLIPHLIKERCGPSIGGRYPSKCALEVIEKVLYRMQPAPPGCVRIRLKLIGRERRNSNLDRITWSAIYLGLTLFGIGKASSRGFGRFVEEGTDYETILEHLKTLINYVAGNRISVAGEDTAIYKVDKVMHPCPLPLHLWPGVRVGTESTKLVNRHGRIIKENIPCIHNKGAPTSSEGVLSAIGHATLKAVWKIVKGKLMKTGKHYHTWVLGLPRASKIGRHRMGYLLHKTTNNGITTEEGRRASTVIISPIGTGSAIIVKTAPINDDLEHITTRPRPRDYGELYHHGMQQTPVRALMNIAETPTTTQTIKTAHKAIDIAKEWIEYLLT